MTLASVPPAVVGVIGGGRMGTGIAQSFAAAGSSVVVVEHDEAAATVALNRIADGLRRAAERGGPADPPPITYRTGSPPSPRSPNYRPTPISS